MINLKEHFKLTAVYTIFAAFPAMLQLIVYPIIEGDNRLGPEDFGYLAITEVIISLVFTIVLFGTGNGLARLYYDKRENMLAFNRLVSNVLTGILARGFFLFGLSVLFTPLLGGIFSHTELQNFGEYGPHAFISGLNRAIIFMAVVLYRHQKKLLPFVIVSLFSGLFRSGFQVAGVLFYDMSFRGYVYGTAIGGGLVALCIVFYLYHQKGFHFNKQVNRSLYAFSTPLFFSELIFWGLLFGDRFFLLANPGSLGIYDNAMKFAVGVQFIIQGLSAGVQPEIFRFFKQGVKQTGENIKKLASLFMAESLLIVGLAILPVMAFIHLFYQTQLQLSAGIVAIIFIRFILRAQYLIFSWPVMYSKKTIYFFVINILILAVNLTINAFLTPKIGYYGAIIAFTFAAILQVSLFYFIQQKIMPISWNLKKLLFFPLGIVLLAALLETAKWIFDIHSWLTALMLVFSILLGLTLVYKNEIVKYFGKKKL